MNFYIKKCKKYNRINDINIDREETIVRSVNIGLYKNKPFRLLT